MWKRIPEVLRLRNSVSVFGKKDKELSDINYALEKIVKERAKDSYLLASIVESTADAIITVDLDFNITSWNLSAEKIYGYNKSEIIGQHWAILLPLRTRAESIKLLSTMFSDNRVMKFEVVRVHKNGEELSLALTASPIYSDSGEIIGICTISRDISARKKFENAIYEHEKLLSTVLNNIPVGILSANAEGEILIANPALENMFGYELGELIGKKVSELVPLRLREDLESRRIEYWGSPEKQKLAEVTEFIGLRKDGFEVPIEIGVAPVVGERREVFASMIDITEKKASALRLETENNTIKKVLELNTDGWWDWNILKREECYFSPTFKKLFGYEANELPNTSETWLDLVHPDDCEATVKSFERHLEVGGERPYYQQVRYRHRNGSIVHIICKGAAFKGKSGKYERMIGVHFDITKEIKLEEDLKRINKNLSAKNEEMEQFVYTVSHDLKSPIVTSMSFLNFLKEDLAANRLSDAQDSLLELECALIKMRSLIKDILEISRVGIVKVEFVNVNLDDIVAGAIEAFKVTEDEKRFKFIIDKNLGVICGDYQKIVTALNNLISNAIKYSHPDRDLVVRISSEKHENHLSLCVEDNGVGIDKRYHKRIFELFQRLDNTQEGTGVGLSIVAKIMDQHNGKVWVESEISKGSKFWLSFPLESN